MKDETRKEGLERLTMIMARLREPGGCPWDREQDFTTLVPYIIEEAYEVVAAIDSGSMEELKDELGDLLFQVVFLSRLAEEDGAFDISEVIASSAEKMVRRHPHVFEDTTAETSADVMRNWAEIKEREKKDKSSSPPAAGGQAAQEGDGGYLSDIPETFPALMRAHKVSKRASKAGFEWASVDGALEKVREEFEEFSEAFKEKDSAAMEEEIGDLFFSLVNVSRFAEIEPENALRKTIEKFVERFHFVERELVKKGLEPASASLEEMELLWKRAKRVLRKRTNTER